MTTRQIGAGANGFVPAQVHRVAPALGTDTVHLWWLPYQHAQGRAPLKALLAAYLDIDPNAVSLVDGEHGRPSLAGSRALGFNWSHSGDHALVAIARNLPELGVDIEQCRRRPRALALAERFFAQSEYAQLQSLPPDERNEAFIRLWTAKESVLKAQGRGLAYGLERIVFTLDAAGWQPHHFQGDVGEAGQWQLHGLESATGFHGSLAWHGTVRSVGRYTTAYVNDGRRA